MMKRGGGKKKRRGSGWGVGEYIELIPPRPELDAEVDGDEHRCRSSPTVARLMVGSIELA